MTFQQIAEDLNKKKNQSVRGKKFKGTNVHSILIKWRNKEEELKRKYPEEWSEFSSEVVNKSLIVRFD